ncbi:hypothetical protein TSAR_013540 [Trichomalopsis sarcophagae]|uniref:Uncharacterized protein n=1 Tax=Trichomalopsis sarcophagae TaxID=543379 RepID=A0A232EJG4_9HYME|nr:hypothetical protein TSAR_013540 [Trichomalopsis sarcophagae]
MSNKPTTDGKTPENTTSSTKSKFKKLITGPLEEQAFKKSLKIQRIPPKTQDKSNNKLKNTGTIPKVPIAAKTSNEKKLKKKVGVNEHKSLINLD